MKDNIEIKFNDAQGYHDLFINGVLQYGLQEVSIFYKLGMEQDIIEIKIQRTAISITKNGENK